VKHSIEILGLNRLDRLNKKRAMFWESCLQEIAEYSAQTAAQALRKVSQASARSRVSNKWSPTRLSSRPLLWRAYTNMPPNPLSMAFLTQRKKGKLLKCSDGSGMIT
jgi:hypothetical protein